MRATKQHHLLYVSAETVARLLDPAKVVQIAEECLLAQAQGKISWSSPRTLQLRDKELGTYYAVKACAIGGVVGVRVTSTNRTVAEQPAPSRMVLLNDPETSCFFGIIDERWSYAVRTGAGVAVAAKYLRRTAADTVGLVGAGLMARGTLYALMAVMPIRQVYVTSTRPETRALFAQEMHEATGLPVAPLDSSEELLAKSEVVVTATTAKEPFIRESWLKPGVLVYSMGAQQELDMDAYLAVDHFVVDDWEQVQIKADVQQLVAAGHFGPNRMPPDLSQIVAGLKVRQSDEDRIVLRSHGLASMDTALSLWLYEQAELAGAGCIIPV